MKKLTQENSWISFSDIMTGLMVIFMFIALSFMMKIQEGFEEFKLTKENIYNDLDSVFVNDFERWEAKLNDDLTISFENPQVLFSSGSYRLTPKFKEILNEFFPKYFSVLLQEKYTEKISEIRIEGHTSPSLVKGGKYQNPYLDNLALSQKRAENVMAYYVLSSHYENLNDSERRWLIYNFTSNGLSYSKQLDKDGVQTFISNNECDFDKSRRVEFRIVTSSEKLFEKVINEITR